MVGMTHNRELMAAARQSLAGKWNGAAGVFFVYLLLLIVPQMVPIIGGFAALILAGPFVVGMMRYVLNVSRGESAQIGDLFSGFNRFGQAFCTYLLVTIYVFLWTLLLIIPGILASLSYAMVWFILQDHPELSANEAIGRSKKIMYGNRWKFFCQSCRFIGWMLLVPFTLGIGYFWLCPYMAVSMAKFYEDIRDRADELKVV